MSTLHIACAAEGDYLEHSAAMLHSVLEHRGGHDVHVHYLHASDLHADALSPVETMLERHGGTLLSYAVDDEAVAGLPVAGFTLKATWYRVFLPSLLPDVERVLYLDADAIAMRSLAPLWATELGDHLVAAVTNAWQWNHVWRPGAMGLDLRRYFNCGVLLMNLELMRRENTVDALLRYGREHADQLPFRDQDAMNAVLAERRLALHPRWNCMNSILSLPSGEAAFGRAAVEDARRSPGIRHFEGPLQNKPWHRNADPELQALYARHRAQAFGGRKPARTGRSFAARGYPRAALTSVMKRERPLPRIRMPFRVRSTNLWRRTGGRLVTRLALYELIERTGNFGDTRWLNAPVWQNVLDLWTTQEAIAEVRPKLLIEVGTHKGGSALYYANLMDLLGEGRVITIDIVKKHELDHPRVEFLLGSSIEPDTVAAVEAAAERTDGAVMVILDGNHARDHVATELELYSRFVTPGSLLLSQDGVIDQLRLFRGGRPGPLDANRSFLQHHPEFEYDRERNERYGMTHHPLGWMRRLPVGRVS